MTESAFSLRCMEPADYSEVFALWEHIHGFALRKLDDSEEYVTRFLRRNPTTSVVAQADGKIVGAILCGHDGRQGSFYHVCVAPEYRKHGVGRAMVKFCLAALNAEGVSKATLVAFEDNQAGNAFWHKIGWKCREDFLCYEFIMNQENITRYVQ